MIAATPTIPEPRERARKRSEYKVRAVQYELDDFRHALVQEVAYGSLLRRDRRKAHGTVAELLRAKDRNPPAAREEIAFHLGLAEM